jgi:hypothetical protein
MDAQPNVDDQAQRRRLQNEAAAAAQRFADVNEACPYPFSTWQGRVFREHFNALRALMPVTNPKNP